MKCIFLGYSLVSDNHPSRILCPSKRDKATDNMSMVRKKIDDGIKWNKIICIYLPFDSSSSSFTPFWWICATSTYALQPVYIRTSGFCCFLMAQRITQSHKIHKAAERERETHEQIVNRRIASSMAKSWWCSRWSHSAHSIEQRKRNFVNIFRIMKQSHDERKTHTANKWLTWICTCKLA